MLVHGRLEASRVNGPGLRSVIWLQGCDINGQGRPRCAGCWNPETHDPNGAYDAGLPAPRSLHANITPLVEWIEKCYRAHRIEGVTFSGGEPIHQISALITLADIVRTRMPFLSLGLYSGYTDRELSAGSYYTYTQVASRFAVDEWVFSRRRKAKCWHELRCYLDFGILGRYNQLQPSGAPMTTSTNQEIVLYSERYTLADFPPQSVEVHINESGNMVQITGFPTV